MKWNGTRSNQVYLSAGVKQGGILFPFLFALFVDKLLDKLELSGLGCYVAYTCYNSFMYADDLILVSNSVTGIQMLFNLSAEIFTLLDLPVNISKYSCLRIGPRCKVECSTLKIHDANVQWVKSIKYLGVTILQAKEYKCSWDEAKENFIVMHTSFLGD